MKATSYINLPIYSNPRAHGGEPYNLQICYTSLNQPKTKGVCKGEFTILKGAERHIVSYSIKLNLILLFSLENSQLPNFFIVGRITILQNSPRDTLTCWKVTSYLESSDVAKPAFLLFPTFPV